MTTKSVSPDEVRREAEQTRAWIREQLADQRCTCVQHGDGSVTTFLCPLHAAQDPCATMAAVTGRRRHGSVVRGCCTNCGWQR